MVLDYLFLEDVMATRETAASVLKKQLGGPGGGKPSYCQNRKRKRVMEESEEGGNPFNLSDGWIEGLPPAQKRLVYQVRTTLFTCQNYKLMIVIRKDGVLLASSKKQPKGERCNACIHKKGYNFVCICSFCASLKKFTQAKERQVGLFLMPTGMSKRKRNSSK